LGDSLRAQITIEFTVVLIILLLLFITVVTAIRSAENVWLSEKRNIELKTLCNVLADSIVKKNVDGNSVKVFVPSQVSITYREGYLVCQRGQFVAVSPIPGGFRSDIQGNVYGWVEV